MEAPEEYTGERDVYTNNHNQIESYCVVWFCFFI